MKCAVNETKLKEMSPATQKANDQFPIFDPMIHSLI
jgi:hypothetical protein